MPCSDGGVPYPPTPAEIAHAKFVERAPSLICSACRALERLGYDFDENPELSEWWDKHKKADEARMADEAKVRFEKRIIEDALKKPLGELSDDEKKILRKHKYL